jgi:hypothetical protein
MARTKHSLPTRTIQRKIQKTKKNGTFGNLVIISSLDAIRFSGGAIPNHN